MIFEMLIPIGTILLLLFLGFYLLQGKGAMLIAGYNTLPKEEKEKYDEVALCKATGKLILAIAFSMMVIFAGIFLVISVLLTVGTVLLVITILFGLIYMNTGNRYKKDGR